MSVLNFPAPDQSPWVAPNGSIYVYVGTEPNGYWKGSKSGEQVGDGAITLKQGGVEIGAFTVNQDSDETIEIAAGGGGGSPGPEGPPGEAERDWHDPRERRKDARRP